MIDILDVIETVYYLIYYVKWKWNKVGYNIFRKSNNVRKVLKQKKGMISGRDK